MKKVVPGNDEFANADSSSPAGREQGKREREAGKSGSMTESQFHLKLGEREWL
jgi:hypothetical protein